MKCKILGPIHKFYFCEVELNYALLDFYDTNQRKYVYLKNFFVPWRKHLSYDKKKNKFSFYRMKGAPNRTRFKKLVWSLTRHYKNSLNIHISFGLKLKDIN